MGETGSAVCVEEMESVFSLGRHLCVSSVVTVFGCVSSSHPRFWLPALLSASWAPRFQRKKILNLKMSVGSACDTDVAAAPNLLLPL